MNEKEINLQKLKDINSKFYFLKVNFKTAKKFNFSYLRYRAVRPLLKVYYSAFIKLKGVTPWTSPSSILMFEELLTPEMVGFEWGSGSSTIFFAKRLKKLVSIEHHEGWYQKVRSQLQEKEIKNVDYHLINIDYPDQHLDKDGFQVAITPSQIDAYKAYYSFIDQFPDQSFHFILIDGRTRVQCGEHALPKLKSGGLLVLDNSERARYSSLKEKLKDWPSVWTTTGLTDTTIWIKP